MLQRRKKALVVLLAVGILALVTYSGMTEGNPLPGSGTYKLENTV